MEIAKLKKIAAHLIFMFPPASCEKPLGSSKILREFQSTLLSWMRAPSASAGASDLGLSAYGGELDLDIFFSLDFRETVAQCLDIAARGNGEVGFQLKDRRAADRRGIGLGFH